VPLKGPGLPDGLFSNQNPNFEQIFDGFNMEIDVIFYGPFVCFSAIWYILSSFGIFWDRLVYFSNFGKLYKEKSGTNGRA
jgi:hypothetical protein